MCASPGELSNKRFCTCFYIFGREVKERSRDACADEVLISTETETETEEDVRVGNRKDDATYRCNKKGANLLVTNKIAHPRFAYNHLWQLDTQKSHPDLVTSLRI